MSLIAVLIAVGVLGSPVWISGAVRMIPQRWWLADLLLCGLQALIALFLWWFFWGGGIMGAEAGLSQAWQWSGLLAVAPFAACAAKRWIRPKPLQRGFPVVQKQSDTSP